MNSVCNLDCFNCVYPDCIVDEKEYREIRKGQKKEQQRERSARYRQKHGDASRKYNREWMKQYRETHRLERLRGTKTYAEAVRDISAWLCEHGYSGWSEVLRLIPEAHRKKEAEANGQDEQGEGKAV